MPHSLAYLPLWALSRKWDDVLIIYAHSKAQMTCFWSNHFEGRESASRGVTQSEIETSALCRGATYLAQNAADLNSSIFSFRAQFLVPVLPANLPLLSGPGSWVLHPNISRGWELLGKNSKTAICDGANSWGSFICLIMRHFDISQFKYYQYYQEKSWEIHVNCLNSCWTLSQKTFAIFKSYSLLGLGIFEEILLLLLFTALCGQLNVVRRPCRGCEVFAVFCFPSDRMKQTGTQ